jgi:hypothetical protein
LFPYDSGRVRRKANAIFDVALLLADVRARRETVPRRLRSHRSLAEQTGIPYTTIAIHLRDGTSAYMTVEYAARWMLWLGHHDIREYIKEPDEAAE